MSNVDKAALRTARQQRLAGKLGSEASVQQSKQVTTPETKAPAAVASVDVLTAAVLDPKNVSKSASLSLQLFNEGSSDPHWLVCADGQPVAQIRLSDQEDVDSVAKVFTTDGYANGIVSAAARMDLEEILVGVRARPYVASVHSADAYKAMEAELTSKVQADLRKAKSNLRNDMINTLNLVVTAQAKNFIVENALKDALYSRMTACGIENDRAVSVIEAAFQEKSSEYFEAVFKQAIKWGNLTPEAYNELQEQINDMPQRMPAVEVSASAPVAAAKNIHLSTYGGFEVEASASDKDKLRETLGFNRRYNASKTSR